MPRRRLTRLALFAAVAFVTLYGVAWALFLREPEDGRGTTRAFSTGDFRFDYPADWHRIEGLRFPLAENDPDTRIGDATFGLDRDNWVGVSFVSSSPQPIVSGNIDQTIPYTRQQYARFAAAIDGELTLRPTVTSAAGLPTIETRIAFTSETGAPAEDRLISLFDGTEIYAVNCQHRRDAPREVVARISDGCETVLETFEPQR